MKFRLKITFKDGHSITDDFCGCEFNIDGAAFKWNANCRGWQECNTFRGWSTPPSREIALITIEPKNHGQAFTS